jgi:hypothetical protein
LQYNIIDPCRRSRVRHRDRRSEQRR